MENLFDRTYKGKRVLITGHTGFKGSWLALWLSKLGAEVLGYSKDIPTVPSHFKLLNLKLTSIEGDILDKEKIYKTIAEFKPDIIFHLAAQSLVKKSYSDPALTFETNIIGSINIFEACRKLKFVKAIINVTSDKCYKNKESEKGYKEEDPMGGDDPYSASKGAIEIVTQSYRKSFFALDKFGIDHSTLLSNVRAGNVVGGGDWADDRLIPDLVRGAEKNEKTIIRNPRAIRPWQHVLDPLCGYLQLGAKLLNKEKEFADNWNFGPDDQSSATVREVTQLAQKHWSKITCEIVEGGPSFKETNVLKLNSQKVRKTLGWQSIWNLDRTIEYTINWYKKYYIEKGVASEKDLEEYINDAKKLSLNWTK